MPKRGFTLIELLTITAMIGVLAAVSWSPLTNLQRKYQIKQEAEKVANLLRDAQERSLSEQTVFGALIDPLTQQVSLINYGATYTGQTTHQTIETDELPAEKVIIDSTTIYDADSQKAIVRYTRAGLPSTTGTVIITDKNQTAGSAWTVEIAPAGTVKVHQ